ncbi:MAG: glycine--tRNA ligase subunit beta [Desulfohalobiaceae bacterium]
MSHFVLEIGTEEMPARFLPQLERELENLFRAALKEKLLPFDALVVHATPRRLVADVQGLAGRQGESRETLTGPPVAVAYDQDGNPTKAALGFARSQGVPVEGLFRQVTDKGEYLAVEKVKGGGKSSDLLPEVCTGVISGLTFPKKMRWESLGVTFGRPLRWLLALLDNAVVDFTMASLRSGRRTFGHRVMGPGPWTVPSASDYFEIIEGKGRVVLSAAERRARILEQGNALAGERAGRVIWNQGLLEEVTGLVEWPQAMLGGFDTRYLELPREVLLTSMETHQKCFGVEDLDGRLLSSFLYTVNLESDDPSLVRKGWERVLKARLEDARFFFEVDCRAGFSTWLKALDSVVFLAPLGSMGGKSRRLEQLCRFLGSELAPGREQKLGRAGRLAKADLVSEMVGEFPDLQGIMGGIYAANQDEAEEVSSAVYEHYLPTGHDSPVPQTVEGAILALADKADTLVGCFGLDMVPTGANDPYALRRHALGIIRIVIQHGFRLDLGMLLKQSMGGYGEMEWKLPPEAAVPRLIDFFAHRLRAHYTAKGFATRVVDAVLGADVTDLWAVDRRLQALDAFSREQDFEQAVLTFKRADNIIRKQAADQDLDGSFILERLQEPQEQELGRRIVELAPRWEVLWGADDFAALFALLRELRPAVDDFFDHVMVMCDDRVLRLNRCNLLKALVDRLSRLADFSALQI